MFERLRETLEALLDAATPPDDPRAITRKMHEAVVEARAGLHSMGAAITTTKTRLEAERRQLADAERRGTMAAEIGDQETVDVANVYVAKHRERVAVLERKLEAQREELALGEREFGEMREQLRAARERGGQQSHLDSAWRSIEEAGGSRPEVDVNDEILRTQLNRAAREAAAEDKLKELKKKMGR